VPGLPRNILPFDEENQNSPQKDAIEVKCHDFRVLELWYKC